MNPPASATAQIRLSSSRTAPEIVLPPSMFRMELVMAIPGIRSMMSPIRIISMCSTGTSRQRKPTPSPVKNEMNRLDPVVLICVWPSCFCRKQISSANTAAVSPSQIVPPKNTAKPPAARMLPQRITLSGFFPFATCSSFARSSVTGIGEAQQDRLRSLSFSRR